MASAKAIALLDNLSWTLIYGGIVAVIVGLIAGDVHVVAGWSLGVLGGIAFLAGCILIWVRSRLCEPAPPGAQSTPPSQGNP